MLKTQKFSLISNTSAIICTWNRSFTCFPYTKSPPSLLKEGKNLLLNSLLAMSMSKKFAILTISTGVTSSDLSE